MDGHLELDLSLASDIVEVATTPRLQSPFYQSLKAKYPKAFKRHVGSETSSVCSEFSGSSNFSLKRLRGPTGQSTPRPNRRGLPPLPPSLRSRTLNSSVHSCVIESVHSCVTDSDLSQRYKSHRERVQHVRQPVCLSVSSSHKLSCLAERLATVWSKEVERAREARGRAGLKTLQQLEAMLNQEFSRIQASRGEDRASRGGGRASQDGVSQMERPVGKDQHKPPLHTPQPKRSMSPSLSKLKSRGRKMDRDGSTTCPPPSTITTANPTIPSSSTTQCTLPSESTTQTTQGWTAPLSPPSTTQESTTVYASALNDSSSSSDKLHKLKSRRRSRSRQDNSFRQNESFESSQGQEGHSSALERNQENLGSQETSRNCRERPRSASIDRRTVMFGDEVGRALVQDETTAVAAVLHHNSSLTGETPSHSHTEASHSPTQASHSHTEASHSPTEASHSPTEASHSPTEASHSPTQASHSPTEASHSPTEASHSHTEASHSPTAGSLSLAGASHRPDDESNRLPELKSQEKLVEMNQAMVNTSHTVKTRQDDNKTVSTETCRSQENKQTVETHVHDMPGGNPKHREDGSSEHSAEQSSEYKTEPSSEHKTEPSSEHRTDGSPGQRTATSSGGRPPLPPPLPHTSSHIYQTSPCPSTSPQSTSPPPLPTSVIPPTLPPSPSLSQSSQESSQRTPVKPPRRKHALMHASSVESVESENIYERIIVNDESRTSNDDQRHVADDVKFHRLLQRQNSEPAVTIQGPQLKSRAASPGLFTSLRNSARKKFHKIRRALSLDKINQTTSRQDSAATPGPATPRADARVTQPVASPLHFRPLGRVLDFLPDGSRRVQLFPQGLLPFYLTPMSPPSPHTSDSHPSPHPSASPRGQLSITRLSHSLPASFFTGLMAIGDVITHVNEHPVTSLTVDEVYALMTSKNDVIVTLVTGECEE